MMRNEKKDLLFLGGFGAPIFIFKPWFAAFKRLGYRIHPVPNSFLTTQPVSTFADRLVELSERFDEFDVIGVSYGGNAALYGAWLSEELCVKVDKMLLVCAPLLGIPQRLEPLVKFLPPPLSKTIDETVQSSAVVDRVKDPRFLERIDFDLHCIYHERDSMAPFEKATLPGVGTNHKLDFNWRLIPSLVMHQAAAANPQTMKIILRILRRDP